MLVVDSSVWVDLFNNRPTAQVELLRELLPYEQIGVGDLVLFEILQGFRSEAKVTRTLAVLSRCEFLHMVSPPVAQMAAANYRFLRSRGITIRSSIDSLIATAVIAGGHILLHNDRDFDHFEKHLGLRVMHP
jgi:predicted nucleic acid-binding protein